MEKSRWRKALLPGAAVLILVWFIWYIRRDLPPFLIAYVLASLLDPLLDRLQIRFRSRGRAVLLVTGALVIILVAAGGIIIPLLLNQATGLVDNFEQYYNQVDRILTTLTEDPQRVIDPLPLPASLKGYIHNYLEEQEASVEHLIAQYSQTLSAWLSSLVRNITGFLVGLASKALWLIIIPIVTFYFLYDIDRIRARIVYLLPARYKTDIVIVAGRVATVWGSYLQGQIRLSILYAITLSLIFGLLGLDYFLILGIFAGIMYVVPYIGAIATTVIVTLIALTTGSHSVIPGLAAIGKPVFAVTVAGILIFTNQVVFDQIVTPRVLGRTVGLHPILSIFALVIGGSVFGIVGMILAVPLAASLQAVVVYLFPQITEPLPSIFPTGVPPETPQEQAADLPPNTGDSPGAAAEAPLQKNSL
ncbi:MAG: AI-2E family transporter [Armatimonadetes bacterium]|nr:AI-2E family transporter [Armatimonadota bacterium]